MNPDQDGAYKTCQGFSDSGEGGFYRWRTMKRTCFMET